MNEILPGIFHWTVVHPKIKIEVSSYYAAIAGVLIDPLIPAEGLDWFRGRGEPREIVITNRHHYRHSAEFEQAFGCTVWCNEAGLHEFTHGERVQGFEWGRRFAGGIESHAVGVLCPDETALRIPGEEAALAVADGVVRDGAGPLAFVPDVLLGDEPETIKRGLKQAYTRLLELDFEHLLLAHGQPWVGEAKAALREFVAGPV
jgi:hypothetical protein